MSYITFGIRFVVPRYPTLAAVGKQVFEGTYKYTLVIEDKTDFLELFMILDSVF